MYKTKQTHGDKTDERDETENHHLVNSRFELFK